MNAQELFNKDGKPVSAHFCSECRIIRRTREEAEDCCAPKICPCGAEIDHNMSYTICRKCMEDKAIKREKDRYDAAEKVQHEDYVGPVFYEGVGYQDGFFSDVGEFLDQLEDGGERSYKEILEIEYVWACHVRPICTIEVNRAIEGGIDETYEDFSSDQLMGRDELEKALDAFNELNKDKTIWLPDYEKAVIVKDLIQQEFKDKKDDEEEADSQEESTEAPAPDQKSESEGTAS